MVISKRTVNNNHHNTTSSISQSNHYHHQQSDRKLRALKNCSKWNSALLQGRRSRGPQWDYSTASYHIAKNSIAYFTGVTPLDQSNSSDVNPSSSTSTTHSLSIQPHQLNHNSHLNQHFQKQPLPYLSQASSSQSHPINSTSAQLTRSSSFHQPALRPPQIPSPHPSHPHDHQIQSQPFQVGPPKPPNLPPTINDPKFGPFILVSNNQTHPASTLVPQSNLSTHSTGTIGPPSSHFSSGSVSSSSGAHPPGPHIGNRQQISPTGIPSNEQKNQTNPETSQDQSTQELNMSRHSSIDKSHSQPNPPPPPPQPVLRSNPEAGISQPQAYPTFHPPERSPQFQTQPQTNHIQYPPHLIPPPASPDKPSSQPSPSTNEHPPQLSPIPPPTPQDQPSPNFRPPTQWSPNPNYNQSSLPYPPTHQLSPQFSSQQFPNQTPQPMNKAPPGMTAVGVPNIKPPSIDTQHPHLHNPQTHTPTHPGSTPNSASRPIFSPHPYPPFLQHQSPTPSALPPPPPNANFKTVNSFPNLTTNNGAYATNLQQIQQQQQAQIAIKNQQAQLIANKVKQQQQLSAHPQGFQPQPPPPQSQPGYNAAPGGYLKPTGTPTSNEAFGNPMAGFGGPSGGYMGFNQPKSMSEAGVGVPAGNGTGEVGNESASPEQKN